MLSLFTYLSLSAITLVPSEPIDSFPLPSVPASLTDPSARAELIVSNFFNNAVLPDAPSESLETAIVNFSTVAHLASEEARATAAKALFGRATTPETTETLRNTLEKYLFNGDSPYLNLDLFITFLEADKPSIRRDGLLNLISANRSGSTATDIPLQTSTGKQTSLREIANIAPLTLLIFFDPECDHCRELTLNMSRDSNMADAVKNGKITILAVTPDAESPEVPAYFPKEWIVSVDDNGAINENDLYYIPSYPEVYVIERDNMKVVARGLRTIESIHDSIGF